MRARTLSTDSRNRYSSSRIRLVTKRELVKVKRNRTRLLLIKARKNRINFYLKSKNSKTNKRP